MTVLRFAVAPRGWLLVGQAQVALYASLFARASEGRLWLRLDDLDAGPPGRPHVAPHFVQAIEHDLRWLGLAWDGVHRQSGHAARYAEAFAKLRDSGRLYPCFESEEELRAKREARVRRGLSPIYDRAMVDLTPAQRSAAEAGGKRPHWRFRLSGHVERWDDLVLGPCEVKLSAVSDPVIVQSNGQPLHTLMSVVDDIDLGISHVVRGAEHITNSAVRRDLMTALGVSPARIALAHVPLVQAAMPVRRLRASGFEAATVAAYLASGGRAADPTELSMASLTRRFAWSSIDGARFEPPELLALNRRVLGSLSYADVASRLPSGATEAFWLAIRNAIDLLPEARGWWEIVSGSIVPPVIEGQGDMLRQAARLLPPEPVSGAACERWIAEVCKASGAAVADMTGLLSLALTGEEDGPHLCRLLPLMGRGRAAERLIAAAS